jgi:predicted MFS family arabinose efflux permease
MGATFLLVLKFVPQPPDVALDKERTDIGGALREYVSLLRRRDVLIAATVFALLFFSMALYITYLPAWLTAKEARRRAASPRCFSRAAWRASSPARSSGNCLTRLAESL